MDGGTCYTWLNQARDKNKREEMRKAANEKWVRKRCDQARDRWIMKRRTGGGKRVWKIEREK